MHRTPRAGRRAVGAAAAAGVIAAATLATGCSSSSDSDREPAAIDIAATSRAAVHDGGTLRWAVDGMPDTLNAFQDGADQQTQTIAEATLPTLFTVDGHGRPQRDGDYLASADVTGSAPQTVVYHLNPKAVWSNGRHLGVSDFTAQWKALNGDDTDFYSAHNTGYDRVSKIQRGKDAREIKVTFSKPTAAWQSLFSPLYPREVTGSPNAFNEGVRDELPVSAGPFALQDLDTDNGTATLVRNRHWWGDRAKLRRLVLTAVPGDRRVAALKAKRVDVAAIDATELPAAGRIGGVAVRKAPGAEYTQLTLNGGGSGPLADERVRKAVARAIDRRQLAEYVLRPAGLPVRTLGNHLVLGSQFGYQDNSSAIGRPSVRSAQALLTEAGWQQGRTALASPTANKAAAPQASRPRVAASASGSAAASASALRPAGSGQADVAGAAKGESTVVEPTAVRTNATGNQLTLRFMLPAGSPTLDAVGDRIAHMLAGVGVRTEMDKVKDDSFFRDHVATGDFDLALYSWPGSAFPADDARPVYLKPLPQTDGSLDVRQNYSRVGTDQIDQLLDRAAGQLDARKARGLTQQADARIWAAAGSIPLYQPPQLVAERSDVVNAGAFGFRTPRFQDIGFRR
ncbi:ABC transporter family substrate-binding protein [Streptantibioticus silvisoli]|uniref:ABC transporter family substrate-binding protein n=1 Tax=Streptantibioticus silvisoli TaxID=2705255 RepID=A0ABT6W9U7_9ACTN|nr:ABC transporter family substrate-binding protein [Streptantibioticus silvisoli]MDI5967523.1 ABC transporter family substrate-binding protein [Streptantibioticus silvisoli]